MTWLGSEPAKLVSQLEAPTTRPTPYKLLIIEVCLCHFESKIRVMWNATVDLASLFSNFLFNSSNGRIVRASASAAVDSGLNPSRVKPMNL